MVPVVVLVATTAHANSEHVAYPRQRRTCALYQLQVDTTQASCRLVPQPQSAGHCALPHEYCPDAILSYQRRCAPYLKGRSRAIIPAHSFSLMWSHSPLLLPYLRAAIKKAR